MKIHLYTKKIGTNDKVLSILELSIYIQCLKILHIYYICGYHVIQPPKHTLQMPYL